ncbi:MAG: PA14 domain-containing protein [Armatimonadetes bacterium]|nr:PA14 domain-containing protein [Armatimonadota bacterium]
MGLQLFSISALVLCAAMVSAQPGDVISHQKIENGLLVKTQEGTLRLSVYSPNAIRVTYAPGSRIPQISSLAVIAEPASKGWEIKESKESVSLETSVLRAIVDLKTGGVAFYSKNQLLFREAPGGRKLTPAVVSGEKTLGVEQRFTVGDQETFYGLGQDQSGMIDRAGKVIYLKQGNTDKSVPVLLSSKGYGLFWDNPSYGKVDLSKVKTGSVSDEMIPSSALIAADGAPGGLTGEYFSDMELKTSVRTAHDAQVDFNWSVVPPDSLPHDIYSVRWTGELAPNKSGQYQLITDADDGVRLWLGGKLIIDDWNAAAIRRNTAKVKLEAGKRYSIKLEFFQNQFDARVSLRWTKPAEKSAQPEPELPVEISFGAEVAKAIDYYVLAGSNADETITGYRLLTGDAPLYGKWVYGYWQCKERYKTADELLEVAEGFRSRNIPIDNLIQDWQYWQNPWGSHEFDKTRYPDPAGLIKTLHEKYKLHVMISVWPKFMKGGSNYDEMEKQGFLFPEYVWFGGAMQRYYDPYSPKARELFWKQVNEKLFSLGIDAWWLDGDEPEVTLPVPDVNGIDYGHPSVFHGFKTALGPGSGVLNAYPLMHTKTFYDGQRKVTDKKRVFLLSRCSYAGMQRNAAACWSGDIPKDWDSLRRQIPGGLNFVMSGLPYWNTDIGGFWGGVDGGDPESLAYRELFVRWLQYGAFCPMMRVHGESPNKEPWRFGPDTEKTITGYINLRYRLLPYIYSTAWMITNGHYSMMRPLVMDFANDANALKVSDQFMFGPAMLISPVTTKGATSREVYLPAGSSWVDFWTGKAVNGGQTISADAPVKKLPIFIKAGSIIPMGPFVQYSTEKPADPIELRVYPGVDGKFMLYEDENDSYNYEKGAHATITFTWNDARKELTIGKREGSFPGMLKDRKFKVTLITPGQGVGLEESKPNAEIAYDGKAVKIKL